MSEDHWLILLSVLNVFAFVVVYVLYCHWNRPS